ncbi:MAG: sigma-70 family RNA polymerase sigma factor, partial [Limnochordales bacterium]
MAALPLPDGGKAARKYTRADFSRMTDEEVVRVAQEGSEDAYDYLLRKYEKLVYIWTRPYFLQGAEDDDLLQEGMIGLYKAIRDFSPGSSSFWSFAKLCITRNVISAIKGTTRQKHIPLNQYTSLHK